MNDTRIVLDDITWTNHQEQECEIDIIEIFTLSFKVTTLYFSRHRSIVSFSDYDNTNEDIDLQNQPQ